MSQMTDPDQKPAKPYPSNDTRPIPNIWMFGVYLIIAAATAFDIFVDLGQGGSLRHVWVEGIVFALSLTAAFSFLLHYRSALQKNRELKHALDLTREDLLQWKEHTHELLLGLGQMIDKQFDLWSFTTSEKEVGLLILKGFGFKEIAELRQTSERTVRQQAIALYRKADVSGRAEFSAFFLEELLLPLDQVASA
ncbi:MAG: response regulator transcription factor [Acidobacteria bacterium]|nr:response regulator transcription factor [Acidobacteriota bacterium]MCB9397330.1 response regulator transcription factor [Acidobacteriota bacterium]